MLSFNADGLYYKVSFTNGEMQDEKRQQEKKNIKRPSLLFKNWKKDIKSYWPSMTDYNKLTTTWTRKRKVKKKDTKICKKNIKNLKKKTKNSKNNKKKSNTTLKNWRKAQRNFSLTLQTSQHRTRISKNCREKTFRFFWKKDSAWSRVAPSYSNRGN